MPHRKTHGESSRRPRPGGQAERTGCHQSHICERVPKRNQKGYEAAFSPSAERKVQTAQPLTKNPTSLYIHIRPELEPTNPPNLCKSSGESCGPEAQLISFSLARLFASVFALAPVPLRENLVVCNLIFLAHEWQKVVSAAVQAHSVVHDASDCTGDDFFPLPDQICQLRDDILEIL